MHKLTNEGKTQSPWRSNTSTYLKRMCAFTLTCEIYYFFKEIVFCLRMLLCLLTGLLRKLLIDFYIDYYE